MEETEALQALKTAMARAEAAEQKLARLVAAHQNFNRIGEEQRAATARTNSARIEMGIALDEVTR